MNRTAMILALMPLAVHAQWLDWRTPGIPRTADGKPDLKAPAPRTPDGKPDLTGIWKAVINPYRLSVTTSLQEESIFRPAAEALFLSRVDDFRRDDPVTNCLPAGPADMYSNTFRIMQTPALIAVLYETGVGRFRQIHMDGRKLPEDPNPTWLGYSVGRWDGDTLVVDSTGFNDRTWLDRAGHPHSEKLRVTERFRREDFGHIQFQITYQDPETLTRSLTLSVILEYAADTDLLENVCNETDRNRVHMISKANKGIQLSPEVLNKYVGKYEFRRGSTVVEAFMGREQTVSFINGRLYLNALPMIPQTETLFESTGSYVEFFLDPGGKVTRMVLGQTEGDAIYEPSKQ